MLNLVPGQVQRTPTSWVFFCARASISPSRSGHGGWGGAGSDGYGAWDHPYDVYLPLIVRNDGRAGYRVKADNHAGGQPYDDASRPRMMGSGGGSAGSAPGGAGGGALRLMVKETLVVSGTLSANGLAGAGCDFCAGGGGAGGSLWIETDTFTGNGVIRADGGNGGGTRYDDTYGQGGGGAGGRVAIYAGRNTFTPTGGVISVAGGSGYEDGEAGTVYVSVTAPSPVTVTADFAAEPTSGSTPLTITLTNLSTSSDEIDGYRWSFGDGSTSTSKSPTHVYTRTGSFTVTLTATVGDKSDIELKADYISVTASSPVTVTADFAATPISGSAPLTVTFTNLSTSSGKISSYWWDFGDGSTLLTTGGATSSLPRPMHVYTQVGGFTVILTATAGSESDVEIKTDHIAVNAPARLELMTRTITYTYDGLHRLTGADYSTGESFTHIYDAAGNRTRTTSTTPLSGTVVTTHTYDAANRLTSRTVSDGRAYSYAWSARGQLLSEWTQGYPVRTFSYDAAGQVKDLEGQRSVIRSMGYGEN